LLPTKKQALILAEMSKTYNDLVVADNNQVARIVVYTSKTQNQKQFVASEPIVEMKKVIN